MNHFWKASTAAALLVLFMVTTANGSGIPTEKVLVRHARAMMFDMRGFPDTEGLCKIRGGAGFWRNDTDCTQFFRCVDWTGEGIKYTRFRFMCGPMAVFDQSRSLCTGPELSQPPCPHDQLDQFFVSMKPMSPLGVGTSTTTSASTATTTTTSTFRPDPSTQIITPTTTTETPQPTPTPEPFPIDPCSINPQTCTTPPTLQTPTPTPMPTPDPFPIDDLCFINPQACPTPPTPPITEISSSMTTTDGFTSVVTVTTSSAEETTQMVTPSETITIEPTSETPDTVRPSQPPTAPPTLPPLPTPEVPVVTSSPEITTTGDPFINPVTRPSSIPPVIITSPEGPVETTSPQTIPSSTTTETVIITPESSTIAPITTTSEMPPTVIITNPPITTTSAESASPEIITVTLAPSPSPTVPSESPSSSTTESSATTEAPVITETVTQATSTAAPITTTPTSSIQPTSATETTSEGPVSIPIEAPTTATPLPFTPSSELVSGFIKVGDEDEDDEDGGTISSTVTFQDEDIPTGSSWGVLSKGDKGSIITVLSSDGTKQTITIPPGSILIAKPTVSGGRVTSVTSTTGQTTSSTIVTYPPGTSYWILTVGSTGQVVKQQVWINSTTSTTTVTVPTSSKVGQVKINNQQQLTNFGQYSFSTTQLNGGSGSNGVICYGVMKRPGSNSTTITTTSTTAITEGADQQFISGIITTGGVNFEEGSSITLSNLTVNNGDLIAVLPPGGYGLVTVQVGDTSNIFNITPGSFFAVLSSGKGLVTNLVQPQQQTWTSSILSFPVGSAVSVIRVGTDGSLIRESFLQLNFPFTVTTSTGSVVGHVGTSQTGSLNQIGTGSFSTQQIKGTAAVVGLLQLGTLTQSMTITECCSGETTGSFQTLSGIVNVGDTSFMTQEVSGVSNLEIATGTTSVAVVSGTIKVAETTSTSSKETSISIPAGGLLGIVTTSGSGQATAIRNGHFTTAATQFTFASGASFSIWNILENGTTVVQNPFTTSGSTVVTVPAGSVFGQVKQSSGGVVTGIGSASFGTQNLMVSDSTGPEVPITLGGFGVVIFTGSWQQLSSVSVSSPGAISSGNLQTIAGILQTGSGSPVTSTTDQLIIPDGSSFAIIPSGGQGLVNVTDGASSASLSVFPGQIFYLMNCKGGKVTQVVNGYFTTSTTTITFGPETVYGVMKIGQNGQLLGLDFNRTVFNTLSIVVQSDGTVGIVQLDSTGQVISSIGGASFAIKTVTSSSTSTNVAVLDNQLSSIVTTTTLSTTTILLSSTTPKPTPKPTPQPPTSGPFNIECSANALHQFPLDCSRFYQCFGEEGQRSVYIFPCAPGLIFDEQSSMCLTPAESVCSDTSSITDISGGGGSSSSSTQVGGFFQINCSGALFRYPLNCNNFYQCFKDDQGEESIFVFSCASGLVFDEPQSQCLLANETTSCDNNDNLFKSPSILFGLKEPIDAEKLVPTSLALFRKKFGGVDQVVVSSPSQPHQAGRGQERMPIKTMVDGALKAARAQKAVASVSVAARDQQPVVQHHSNAPLKTVRVDPSAFGMRIVPRSKSQRVIQHNQ